MEDQKIVQLYLNRDESAIRETADKYGSRLRTVSYRITGDRETSEECENDTYILNEYVRHPLDTERIDWR